MFARMILGMMLIILMTACSTTRTPATDDEDKIRTIKTAKINAQLGIAYLENHDIQRAKSKFLLALRQAPDIPETWYSYAYFLEATGNRSLAQQHYQKAIEVAPNRGDAHNNYGTFLCRQKKYRSAINHFLVAVKDPEYLDPADAYENAGLCALRIPQKRLATYYFHRALLQDPARPTSLMKLAKLDYDIGNYKVAQREMQDLLAIAIPNKEVAQLARQINNSVMKQKIYAQNRRLKQNRIHYKTTHVAKLTHPHKIHKQYRA